ncbi:hypothetical protein ABTA75_19195, partial [Acinetobacter baumannii]
MNIYAEAVENIPQPQQSTQPQEPVLEEPLFNMQLVEKPEDQIAEPVAQVPAFEEDNLLDDVEEQKRRA